MASFWHPSKFQRVSRRRSTEANQTLHDFGRLLDWYTIYIFGGSCPVLEFCHVQNSLCVQVLRSPILAALLHGTLAVGSEKICGVVQGMELRNFRRGRHLYSAGWPSRWASAHILVPSLNRRRGQSLGTCSRCCKTGKYNLNKMSFEASLVYSTGPGACIVLTLKRTKLYPVE